MKHEQNHEIYQFHIALVDSEPSIWRRFQVPAVFSLVDLHQVIKVVMGWHGEEIYEFKAKAFQSQPASSPIQWSLLDAGQITLQALSSESSPSLLYTYAPSEGWLHKLTLDSCSRAETDRLAPYCLAGERSCPPINCGGVWGYEELLDRLNDPEDPEFYELWEQVGPDFDPEQFDLEAVNQQLTQARYSCGSTQAISPGTFQNPNS